MCFREFIKMGFIDKDRVAIWGWVSCQDFVCCVYHLIAQRVISPSKNKLMFDPFGVIDLHLGVWNKMSDTDELFVFHSLMAAT